MAPSDRLQLLLDLNLLASGVMLGVAWIVQLLTYPRFADVAPGRWESFHALHGARITLVVFPAMLVELGTSIVLVVAPPAPIDGALAALRLVLAAATWILTATLSVPLHRRLAHGYDDELLRRLVGTHALRTAAWSAGAATSLALVASAWP